MKMKLKILRHCELSFTILLMSISGDKALKIKFKDGKDLINKGLTNETELKLLGFYTSKGKVFLKEEKLFGCAFWGRFLLGGAVLPKHHLGINHYVNFLGHLAQFLDKWGELAKLFR